MIGRATTAGIHASKVKAESRDQHSLLAITNLYDTSPGITHQQLIPSGHATNARLHLTPPQHPRPRAPMRDTTYEQAIVRQSLIT